MYVVMYRYSAKDDWRVVGLQKQVYGALADAEAVAHNAGKYNTTGTREYKIFKLSEAI